MRIPPLLCEKSVNNRERMIVGLTKKGRKNGEQLLGADLRSYYENCTAITASL